MDCKPINDEGIKRFFVVLRNVKTNNFKIKNGTEIAVQWSRKNSKMARQQYYTRTLYHQFSFCLFHLNT